MFNGSIYSTVFALPCVSPLQAMHHNVKPASLQQQLEAIHLNSDKAEMFSQTWATAGPELVEKLKQNIFAPKKVRLINNLIFSTSSV